MIYVSKPAVISSAGADAEENFANLCGEKRFLRVCEGFRADKSFILGKARAPLAKFSQNTPKHLQTRTNALVLSALLQIDKDMRDAIKKYGKNRVGVVVGTTTSGVEENYETFKDFAATGFFDASKFGINRNSLANPSEFIADFYELSSVAFSVSTACTSGVKAIITAKRLLESGICDAVICGGEG